MKWAAWSLLVGLLLAFLGGKASHARAEVSPFDLHLVGAQENPPVTDDPANASIHLILDDSAKTLFWTLTIQGVSADLITGAHVHRGALGVNGPVIYPLTTGGGPTTSGKVILTDADIIDLTAGNLYVNIHTAAHPNGAARAQIVQPLELLHLQQLDALNRGDVPGTLAYFADSAVSHVGGCSQTPCIGKDAIRGEALQETAEHIRVTVLSATVSGSTVTEYGEASEDQFKALGISRLRFFFTTTYANGKIVSTAADPDLTDQQTRALLPSDPSPSVRPPQAGDGGLIGMN